MGDDFNLDAINKATQHKNRLVAAREPKGEEKKNGFI